MICSLLIIIIIMYHLNSREGLYEGRKELAKLYLD